MGVAIYPFSEFLVCNVTMQMASIISLVWYASRYYEKRRSEPEPSDGHFTGEGRAMARELPVAACSSELFLAMIQF